MSDFKTFLPINLQFFADGGVGDGGTGSDGATGVSAGVPDLQSKLSSKNPLANVVYGKQDDVEVADPQEGTAPAEDRVAKFEALIKGEYKDLYDQRMSDTVQKRIKGSKETVDKYNALAPTLDMLSKRYGVDASDIDALNKAIADDDSYYEDEALERGISVEQLKSIRKMERENAQLKAQMQEQQTREQADRIYSKWMTEADATKNTYPGFDMDAEMQNPQFVSLLRSNIDVKTAYEVLHKDEIIPAAMQFAQQETMRKMSNSIKANGNRPSENGMSARSASVSKADVSQLSKADRQEIIRRVAAGERIRF